MANPMRPPEEFDDLAFLKQAAEVLSDFWKWQEQYGESEKRAALIAAERQAANWEARRQAQTALCADVGRCSDRTCRRRKRCTALQWMSAKAEAARLRLAAERARWPAAKEEPAPRALMRRHGTTGGELAQGPGGID